MEFRRVKGKGNALGEGEGEGKGVGWLWEGAPPVLFFDAGTYLNKQKILLTFF